MSINNKFREGEYILLGESRTGVTVDFSEWYKADGSNKKLVIRVYEGNPDNRVIVYKSKNYDHLAAPEVLFNGRIDTLEVFELIYSLVKI